MRRQTNFGRQNQMPWSCLRCPHHITYLARHHSARFICFRSPIILSFFVHNFITSPWLSVRVIWIEILCNFLWFGFRSLVFMCNAGRNACVFASARAQTLDRDCWICCASSQSRYKSSSNMYFDKMYCRELAPRSNHDVKGKPIKFDVRCHGVNKTAHTAHRIYFSVAAPFICRISEYYILINWIFSLRPLYVFFRHICRRSWFLWSEKNMICEWGGYCASCHAPFHSIGNETLSCAQSTKCSFPWISTFTTHKMVRAHRTHSNRTPRHTHTLHAHQKLYSFA